MRFGSPHVVLFYQWSISLRFRINERDDTITFEEFLLHFPDNEVREKTCRGTNDRIAASLESQT